MTPPKASIDISVFQDQINSLGDRMDAGFTEIKDLLRSYEERTRAIEQREAGCQPLITGRIDAVWRKVDDHETRLTTKSQQINALERQVARLAMVYNFFVFVSSALGLSVIALIWAMITGQATVIFR
jgi:predicted RNase H-like nuclease (RuvC/YqgF family)